MNRQKRIEIEFRAIFSEKKYNQLKKFLDQNAENLGPDDKNVFFFILPDKLLKVVDNKSKRTAKIVLKLNKIGRGSDFEEIEIPINPSQVKKAVDMFKKLGFTEIQESFQKRHNYKYKDVEIALKWSKIWGYHIELEVLITQASEKGGAEERIKRVAKELGIKLMTDAELAEFTKRADENYRQGKYR